MAYSLGIRYSVMLSVHSPLIKPQGTVCTANVHTPPSLGTSVQVTVVLVVVVGQLPQFDDRMVQWSGQSMGAGLQLIVTCLALISH